MGKGRSWTPDEDEVLRRHMGYGPSWEGYETLLPGRTQSAIMTRRKVLGIASGGRLTRGRRPRPDDWHAPRQKLATEIETTWTQRQIEALVIGFRDMCRNTGHSPRECVLEFASVVAQVRGVR